MRLATRLLPLLLLITAVFFIGAPFLIDVVFYAAYKSLDFGFILLLAVAAGMVSGRKENAQNVASGGGVLYSGL